MLTIDSLDVLLLELPLTSPNDTVSRDSVNNICDTTIFRCSPNDANRLPKNMCQFGLRVNIVFGTGDASEWD